jgi:hypothetical protein
MVMWRLRDRPLRVGLVLGLVFGVVNLVFTWLDPFLGELTGRDDWQNVMQRYRASDISSLRLFVNIDALKGAPFKIGVASVIGAVMGLIGGAIAKSSGVAVAGRV